MDPETERGWNRWFSARLMAVLLPLMDEIGKTTGTLQRELDKLRADHQREIEALRAEIEKLRGASAVDLVALAGKIGKSLRSDEPLDLPDWRRSDAKH